MSQNKIYSEEAVLHPYEPKERTESLLRFNKAIVYTLLLGVLLIALGNVITWTSSQSYPAVGGGDNYLPLVRSTPSSIERLLVKGGEKVFENQTLATIRSADPVSPQEQEVKLVSPATGYFFRAHSGAGYIAPNMPLGFILKSDAHYVFWINARVKTPPAFNEIVRIKAGQRYLQGRIVSFSEPIVEGRGQKVVVRFDAASDMSLLAPDTELEIMFFNQKKTVFELFV